MLLSVLDPWQFVTSQYWDNSIFWPSSFCICFLIMNYWVHCFMDSSFSHCTSTEIFSVKDPIYCDIYPGVHVSVWEKEELQLLVILVLGVKIAITEIILVFQGSMLWGMLLVARSVKMKQGNGASGEDSVDYDDDSAEGSRNNDPGVDESVEGTREKGNSNDEGLEI